MILLLYRKRDQRLEGEHEWLRRKTLTLYFADDGTPFKRKGCLQIYDKICQKYKLWIGRGKVMFWSHQKVYEL